MADIEEIPGSATVPEPGPAEPGHVTTPASWQPAVAGTLVVLSFTGTYAPDSAGAIAAVGTLCAVALVVLFVSMRHDQRGRGWRYVGVGVTLWMIAGCLQVLRDEAAVSTIPGLVVSLVLTAGYVPMLVGIADLCDPHRRIRRLTTAVDGVLLILALYAVLWLVAVEPAVVDSQLPTVDRAFSALFPAGDLALLFLSIRILTNHSARREIGMLLTAGFTFTTAAHITLLVQSLDTTKGTSPLIQLTDLLGLSMVALAAIRSLLPAPPVAAAAATTLRLSVLVAVSALAPPVVLGAIVLFTDRTVSMGPIAAWMLLAVSAAVLRHLSSVREMERTHQEAVWMATHDPATDLLSRTAFLQYASEGSSVRDRSGSVIVVEALGLQALRDSRGYDAVDHVVAAIAERVRAAVGEGALVSRLSHDQVAAFLRAADLARGRQVADGLQRTLAGGVPWGDSTLPLAAVIGLAQADGAVIDVHGGLRRAADAARQARPHGAGHVAVDADITGWSSGTVNAGHPARRDVISPLA